MSALTTATTVAYVAGPIWGLVSLGLDLVMSVLTVVLIRALTRRRWCAGG